MNTFLEIADKVGTPVYIYEVEKIKSQYTLLSKALSNLKHTICFAVKSCSNLSVLSLLSDMGSGFDTVSGGEIARIAEMTARKAGAVFPKTVFAGVGKTADEIDYALSQNLMFFSVESSSELKLIISRANALNKKANVGFRVNPNISVDTHSFITTGLYTSKFGIPSEEIVTLAELLKDEKNISLVALSCHLGSQIGDPEPLINSYKVLLSLAEELKQKNHPIKYIDGGGGFGVSYSGASEPLKLESFAKSLEELFCGTDYEVVVEPGKFIVAEAGSLLTKVTYLKTTPQKNFAITDAGMNDLIRPSLYGAFHKIDLIGRTESDTEKYDVVGPVCESTCFFAKDRDLAKLQEGDILQIKDAGAYGFTMSSNYNSRLRPAEVLIDGDGQWQVVRLRDTLSDIWKGE